ncbi:MAG: oligosaccharide flippase family protein [Ignavibacteria bacterium]
MLKKFFLNNHILLTNFKSLSVIQISNLILPLITLPYLVRILGVEYYGKIQYAYALKSTLLIFTEYGFNFSAVKSIAILDNAEQINYRLNIFIFIKIFLLFISSLVYWVIFFLIIDNNFSFYLINYFHLVFLVFLPLYVFRGIQKVGIYSKLILRINVVSIICVFIFIKDYHDYYFHIIILSISSLILVAISWKKIIKLFSFKLIIPKYVDIKNEFIQGGEIFLATLVASFYTKSIPLFLGFFTNEMYVGIYVAAEKIVRLVESITGILHDTIFPYYSKEFDKKSIDIAQKISNFKKGIYLYSSVMCLTLIAFSNYIVQLFLGSDFNLSSQIIQALSPLIIIKAIGHIYLLQVLINTGFQRIVLQIVIFAAIISLVVGIAVIPHHFIWGSVLMALLPEVFVLFASKFICQREKLI